MLAVLLPLLWPAPSAHAVDPWELRRALILELRALPGDDIGFSAAQFLETSSITLRVAPTHPVKGPTSAAAEYEPGSGLITIDDRFVASAQGARGLRLLATRLAPTVVHEVEHARADAAFPGSPLMREGEFCAYAAEAAFMRRRLAADPDYAGLGEIDERAPRSHPRARPARWWLDPLPPGEVDAFVAPADLFRRRTNYWLVVRASAAGLQALEQVLLRMKWVELPDSKRACSPALDDRRRRACGLAADRYKARLLELDRRLLSRKY